MGRFFCLFVSVRDDVLIAYSYGTWELVSVGFFESVDLGWVILSFYHGLKVTMEASATHFGVLSALSRREKTHPQKLLHPRSR